MIVGVLSFIVWLILAFVVASGAGSRGRSYGGFLLLSLLFSPLIGGLILFMLGENKVAIEQQAINDGNSKKCPFCAEIIKKEAKVCRYCGKELPAEQIESTGKSTENMKINDGYESAKKNGKLFVVIKGGNPDNYYCPFCYSQINPNVDSCYKCHKPFQVS